MVYVLQTDVLIGYKGVVSATQRLGDISEPSGFITELISVGLGGHQVLDTRKKSIAGTTERAKKELFCGGIPLLVTIKDEQYIVNDAEANVVYKIFAMYATGKGYTAILGAVKGIRVTPGKPIGKNSLYSILCNERYSGIYTWFRHKCKLMRKWVRGSPNPDTIRIDGVILPIIDNKTWIEMQNRMSDNKRRANNKAKQDYLLSGLIECEACGGTCWPLFHRHKRLSEQMLYLRQ